MTRSINKCCALITGGAGFIGSHLAEELIKSNLNDFGRTDDLKDLQIPNSPKIREIHSSLIDASELLTSGSAIIGSSIKSKSTSTSAEYFAFTSGLKAGFSPDLISHGENGFLFETNASTSEICNLIEKAGGSVECFLTLIELKFLDGINDYVMSLEKKYINA